MARTGGHVFISYRRAEASHAAGRLATEISHRLPDVELFMDVDELRPGERFEQIITRAVNESDVLLVLIGNDWLSLLRRGSSGPSEVKDYVLLEVGTALTRGTTTIPVLLDGATMPRRDLLPAALKTLTDLHAVHVSHHTFRADLKRLLDAIESILSQPSLPAPTPKPTPPPTATPTLIPSRWNNDLLSRFDPRTTQPPWTTTVIETHDGSGIRTAKFVVDMKLDHDVHRVHFFSSLTRWCLDIDGRRVWSGSRTSLPGQRFVLNDGPKTRKLSISGAFFDRVGHQALRTPTGEMRFWVELVVDERRIWASNL